MSLDLALLRDNFQEIYHAVQHSDSNSLALTADFWDEHIYDATQGWGRFWRYFYCIANGITGKDLRLEKLKQTIIHSHAIFNQNLSLIQADLDKYTIYLKRVSSEYEVKEDDFFKARRAITDWNASAYPFVKMIIKLSHPQLEKLWYHCFEKPINELFNPATMRSLHSCQKIINLEGTIAGPLPLAPIKKILKGKLLKAADTKELDKWIMKINKSASVRAVHGAMKAIAAQFKKNSHHDHVYLEAVLEDKGCTVFEKTDPQHMLWLQQLKRGTALFDIKLGPIIDSKSDLIRIFSLEDNLKTIAVFAQNRAVLAIRNYRQQNKNAYGIDPTQFQYVSKNGRFALMERLQPLHTYVWKSTEGNINLDDIPLLNALGNLLESYIKQKQTPLNFTSDNIMFDHYFKLKSFQPLSKGPFDFNALEDFIFSFSAGNLTIFQRLHHLSKLSSHAIAKFYTDIVANAFKEDNLDVEDLAAIYKIADPKVVDRAKELVIELHNMEKKLYAKMSELHPDRGPQSIKKEIRKAIIEDYKASKAAGVLWPELDRILKSANSGISSGIV